MKIPERISSQDCCQLLRHRDSDVGTELKTTGILDCNPRGMSTPALNQVTALLELLPKPRLETHGGSFRLHLAPRASR
ncbi:hypothetical protein J6590_057097, partial [Homalodisca vitripennis]